METCSICKETITDVEKTVVLTQKGSDSINLASVGHGIDLKIVPGEKVHVICRRNYCRRANSTKDVASKDEASEKRSDLRSQQTPFNFQNQCMFCGQPAKCYKKRREVDVYPVRTKDFKDTVVQICLSRNDSWSQIVSGRLASINDLVAAAAIYHQQCSSNFRTGKIFLKMFLRQLGVIRKGLKLESLRVTREKKLS